MIGDLLPVGLGEFKPALLDELEQIPGDVDYLEIHPEFGVLVFEGVVAMRRRNQDFLHAMIDKILDVFPGQASE